VRVGVTAYGIHLLCKLHIPALSDGYVHFRIFSTGPDEPAKFHSIHTEEKEVAGGHKKFRAIFTKNDPLEWFET
jgi:hypothetical protein